MCDGLFAGGDHPSRPPGAFEYFMLLCLYLSKHSSDLYLAIETEDAFGSIVQFQDRLLSALGIGIPSVAKMTQAAFDGYPQLIRDIFSDSPQSRSLIPIWEEAFGINLQARGQVAKGGCPLIELVYAPRRRLGSILALFSTLTLFRFKSPVDGAAPGPYFDRVSLAHEGSVLHEILYGRRPCAWRDLGCDLPLRPCCEGVVDAAQLRSVGQRCAREAAIGAIVERHRVLGFTFP